MINGVPFACLTVIPILLVISFFRSLEAELYSVVERITPLEDELELAELDLLPLVIPLIIPLIAPPAPPVIPPIIPPINPLVNLFDRLEPPDEESCHF